MADIPKKFIDEKQNIFFANEHSHDIFFLNRTLCDPRLNFAKTILEQDEEENKYEEL